MFHFLVYNAALGVNADNTDLTAVTDSEITVRNNHYIFTESYSVLAALYHAASATRARLNVPTINGWGRHQFFPVLRSATIPDLPYVIDYRDYPLALPENEEIAVEGSNNLGAATEESYAHLIVAPTGMWNRNLPRGIMRINVRATYAITSVADSWSGGGALTFAENLKGGMYAVVGMQVQDANTLAARLIFPRGNVVRGRRLRPGCLSINAAGNRPWAGFGGDMGLWGRFHSFEPPQIEILANNAGAHTGEVRLDLVYLGNTNFAD